jgi:dTDP-glucose 4,6-dehydratase
VYNVSARNELSNMAVVKKIISIMRKKADSIVLVEDRPGHDVRYSLDSSKIQKQLGWKPRVGFREGIVLTIAWYLANEAWWAPLADERTLSPTPWKLKW